MACNQIIRQSIDFAQGQNNIVDLARALEALNYSVTLEKSKITFYHKRTYESGAFQNGKFLVNRGFNMDAVKQEFSRQIVKSTAKQYGWEAIFKEDGNAELRKKVLV